jgi:hypothetical protein
MKKIGKVTAYELFRDTKLISDKEFIKISDFEFVHINDVERQEVGNQIFTIVDLLIGPSEAKFLLKFNVRNRKMKDYHLNALSNDMSTRSNWNPDKSPWIYNAQSIEFDVNGNQINGQNRLTSIVKTGKIIPMKLFINVNSEAFKVYDTGANKNATSVLSKLGVKNPAMIAKTTKMYNAHKTGKGFSENVVKQSRRSMSNEDVYNTYMTDSMIVKSVKFAKKYTKGFGKVLSSSDVSGFHRILSEKSQEDADEFIEKLCTGLGLESGSPILALRKRLIKHKNDENYHLTSKNISLLVRHAWNKFRRGEKIKHLTLPRDFNGEII